MRVKTTIEFRDLVKDKIRKVGEVFDTDRPRAEMLVRKRLVEKIESPKESAD